MKNFIIGLLAFTLLLAAQPALAKKTGYFYRSRANWVKLVELSNKQLAGEKLLHPSVNINEAQMEALLLSLNMNKASLFKKEIKSTEVFTIEEAKKFAPPILQALQEATPSQVVNVAIVHKRPHFILQNDYMSIVNVFVTDEGVHFYFTKLFAKLETDYQQASKMDKAISKAKSMHVSLEAGQGQKLVYSDDNSDEVVADLNFDFVSNTHRAVPLTTDYKPGSEEQVAPVKTAAKKSKTPAVVASEPAATDVASRLKKLDELKNQKLISDAEYTAKRKEILSGL